MKKKIISTIFLIIFLFTTIVIPNISNAVITPEELDPENVVQLPGVLNILNNNMTGTITLSSNASDYKLAYQMVTMTKEQYNTTTGKFKEVNEYINSYNETAKEKKQDVDKLADEYNNIKDSSEATDTEKSEALEKYNKAAKEYNEFVTSEKEKIKNMRQECYKVLPNYTSSWVETTNTTNNVNIDVSNYSNELYFVLWAKISNSTKTYYDFNIYAKDLGTKTDDSSKDKEDDKKESQDQKDASGITVKLKKEGVSSAIIEITENVFNSNSLYKYYIGNSSTEIDSSNIDSTKTHLIGNKSDSGKYIIRDDKIVDSIEKNKDIYISIFEDKNKDGKLTPLVVNKKLEKYSEAKYTEAFSNTFVSYNRNQIITTFTHYSENNRKMQIKIGKITDINILQKIKNGDASGFEQLMKYSKTAPAIYDQTLNCNKSSYLEYSSTNEGNNIKLNNLEDGEYYFLYLKTDDENGNYVSNEAITLTRAITFKESGSWYMFFYGTNDFKWGEFATNGGDSTISRGVLPYTGKGIIIGTSCVLAVIGAMVFYKKCIKFRDI